ncbi:hypothetical protein Vretifemale_15100 [Volvox reticuliferus]|uniref:Cupin type-2 domain-containing protein n=1 Tax=Volvox reticuliferus TaxID=1737510 RepID=A0A8J4CQI9_9CHLO|nr:hypothetical protein Vretifemale_15100 [Volvox reticuliferus]
MAFKATRYFAVIAALIVLGTRYMNMNRKRINLNNEIGIWDTEAKDGQRYTVVTRSNETGGQFFLMHAYCSGQTQGFYPGKPCSPPLHIHDTQDEVFEAISGVLMVNLNGTELQIPIGEKVTVPAGIPHTYWNGGGSEPLQMWVRVSPGTPDEGFLEMVAALSLQFGGLNKVNPMQLVLLFADYGLTLADMPEPLWLAAKKFLVPLARLLGFRSHYPEYVSNSGQPQPVGQAAEEAVAAATTVVEPVVAEEADNVQGEVLEVAAAAVEQGQEDANAKMEL